MRWQPANLWLCAMLSLGLSGCAMLTAPVRESQERHQRTQELSRDVSERRAAAQLVAARECYERGEFEEARKTLVRLLARNPQHAEAQRLLAVVQRAAGEAGEESRVVAASGVGEAPAKAVPAGWDDEDENADTDRADRARAALASAEAALRKGAPELALQRMRAAWATHPQDPQIPISGAALLLRHHQPQAAVALLCEAAERFPRSAAVYRMLGVGYYRLGDDQASQVALQQALSLDKSSALSYFLMGCTLAKSGQSEAAAAHFRQAELLDPRYGVER